MLLCVAWCAGFCSSTVVLGLCFNVRLYFVELSSEIHFLNFAATHSACLDDH